jgi:hypothetical protein
MGTLISFGSLLTGSSGTFFKRMRTSTATPMRVTIRRDVWLVFEIARRVARRSGILLPAYTP